jgi:hypothetical protein
VTDWLVITLDTTPPRVELGDYSGTNAGDFLQIAYTTDEPLARATLIDAGGQRFDLDTGAPDVLTLLLPADVYDGWATIEWADDVGNADRLAAAVLIHSAVVPPPPTEPPKPGGFPRPDKRPAIRRRRLTARSTIVVTSRSRRATRRQRATHREFVTVVATTRVRTQNVRKSHGLAASSRTTLRIRSASATDVALTSETAIRRRDDPSIEAFLMDLL